MPKTPLHVVRGNKIFEFFFYGKNLFQLEAKFNFLQLFEVLEMFL